MNSESTLLAEAVTLKDQVQYGEAAVVSRTLIKRPTGTLTLFAFDKDQELSEHTTPFDAVVHVLDGEVELIIGGQSLHAREGEMVIMPANIPHAVKAVQRFKMMLTMIRS